MDFAVGSCSLCYIFLLIESLKILRGTLLEYVSRIDQISFKRILNVWHQIRPLPIYENRFPDCYARNFNEVCGAYSFCFVRPFVTPLQIGHILRTVKLYILIYFKNWGDLMFSFLGNSYSSSYSPFLAPLAKKNSC